MKTWLQMCQSNHNDCAINLKVFLPSRLIDVQAFRDSPDVRLVDMRPIKFACDRTCTPYPKYVALSHCWGDPSKQPIKTTRETLKAYEQHIAANALSKTFSDAVNITRQLGQQYIWIDSLCIVQDDKKDWETEAALMGHVYSSAFCTLSALSSLDGSQGCRTKSNIRKSTQDCFLDVSIHGTNIRLHRQKPAAWSEEYGGKAEETGHILRNPLRYRAWTMQEAELSQRSIFFADRQLLWQCRTLKATTELPWAEQLPDEVFKMEPWPLCDGLQDDQTEGIFSSTRLRWYQLIEDYSLRQLTYDEDKLTAFAGLARKYQDLFPGAEYVAGMWGPHIPRVPLYRLSDNAHMNNYPRYQLHAGANAIMAHCSATLLWQSIDANAHRYPAYVAPTWSWASVKGRISYDSQRIEPCGNSFDRMGLHEELSDCDFGSMQWAGMTAEPASGDPYGSVKPGAYLKLENVRIARCNVAGQLSPGWAQKQRIKSRKDSLVDRIMKNMPQSLSESDASHSRGEPLMAKEKTAGVFFRDSRDDVLSSDAAIFCLRIRGEPSMSLMHHNFKNEQQAKRMEAVMGIVVVRIEGRNSGDRYRRIGLARWVSASLFQQSRPVCLKLV